MIKLIKVDSINPEEIAKRLGREENSFEAVDAAVKEIMAEVRSNGDAAVIKYTEKFDGARLDHISVGAEEIEEAIDSIDQELLDILQQAKQNIADYHQLQLEKSWYVNKNEGILLGQQITPLNRVGIYVPGGKAAYPSTVLMDVMPAVVAGVKEIALVSPPDKDGKLNPAVLAAASIAGVQEIYKVGGAQAIAALTYGTETIKKVNKIVGPGNIYVARAKMTAFGLVDIDMIAGPSEICIIADETADPVFIAADLLSQAEHDEMAAAILITDSMNLAEKVRDEVEKQLRNLDRYEIARKSIDMFGHIFVTEDLAAAIALANEIAPEHLELLVANGFELLPNIQNAGAIFIGPYSPEPLGDYFAGPNHTLPTNGTAKFSSPLGTYDFMKKSSVIYYNETELRKVKDKIIRFANEEGLSAHANSIRVRFEK